MHLTFLALAFPVLFAILDRLIGSGEYGRSKPMLAAAIAGGGLGYLVFGEPAFALLGTGWAAWRSLAFFNGSLAPEDGSARLACIVRYALMLPIALVAYYGHGDPVLLLVCLVAAAAIGIGLRFDFGNHVRALKAAGQPLLGDPEATIEKITGGLFGLALAAYAFLQANGIGF